MSKPLLHTLLPTLLSLSIILYILPLPAPLHPPLIRPRLPRTSYHLPRNYATYPFGRVCSPAARTHYLTRHTRAPRPFPSAPNLTNPRNRVFLSSIPYEVGDGLGHRSCILNYEITLARLLGLTYTHRHSLYGSLTEGNPHAVEDFFHWGNGSLSRDDVLRDGCTEVKYVEDSCEIPAERPVCARVKPRSKGGLFDQSVIIPSAIADCLLLPDRPDLLTYCETLIRPFLSAYPQPNTLFQLPTERCFREYLYTNFSHTRDTLQARYWRFAKEKPGFDVGRVQVALHVRRGDFFNYTNRVLVSDDTFADVVWRLKIGVDEIVGGDVPTDVHVYSEGVARGRVKDMHDTRLMNRVYIDETGTERGPNHWRDTITRHRRARRGDVQVYTHFASDTLNSVRGMIAADFFVGSVSGLSVQVVRVFGRGVLVLPVWEGEIGDEEVGVVGFDWQRNGVDSFLEEEKLYERIARSVRRNRLACAVW